MISLERADKKGIFLISSKIYLVADSLAPDNSEQGLEKARICRQKWKLVWKMLIMVVRSKLNSAGLNLI
ncbi:hypothetical protein D3C87_1606620 [compost metagenome]